MEKLFDDKISSDRTNRGKKMISCEIKFMLLCFMGATTKDES